MTERINQVVENDSQIGDFGGALALTLLRRQACRKLCSGTMFSEPRSSILIY